MTESQRQFAEPGGDWGLHGINGKRFGSHNLRGSYYIMFFGHTMCPDTTPLTVLKITKAVKALKRR